MEGPDVQRISVSAKVETKQENNESSEQTNISTKAANNLVSIDMENQPESQNLISKSLIVKPENLSSSNLHDEETHDEIKDTNKGNSQQKNLEHKTTRKRSKQEGAGDYHNVKKRKHRFGISMNAQDRLEKEKEKRQQRYLSQREEKIEKQREYYSRNRERMVEKQADYYKANRQEVIARQYEYYQKNKNKITEKKRQWYQDKRGFVSTKKVIHPSLVESISPNEPTKEGCGNVQIKHLKAIIDRFNNEMNKKWKITYDIQHGSDFLSNCGVCDEQMLKPGESKLNSTSENEPIMTLPESHSYRCKPLAPTDILHIESFVALAVSKDEESLDVRYLLHKNNITLEGLRDLFHAIQSVLDIDMHDFLTEKQGLFFINPTCLSNPVLKNRFCKQVGN